MMYSLRAFVFAALFLTWVAAIYDVRTGRIPNWLTTLGMILALGAHAALAFGAGGGAFALHACENTALGAAVCALIPFLLWWGGLAGGGDVKLIAVVGAFCHASIGMESVFCAFALGTAFIVLKLAWEGHLFAMLISGLTSLANMVLPKSRRIAVRAPAMATMKFGPAMAAGMALTTIAHGVLS